MVRCQNNTSKSLSVLCPTDPGTQDWQLHTDCVTVQLVLKIRASSYYSYYYSYYTITLAHIHTDTVLQQNC